MRWPLLLALVLAAAATACDAGGEEVAQPRETVTVVETVTATPDDADALPTEDGPATAGDPCEALAPIGARFAFIVVASPTPGSTLESGDTVAGCGNTFEAAYEWELLDGRGSRLADGFGTMTCGNGCHGEFDLVLEYTVDEQDIGTLRVFERSAQDGSEVNVNAIPVLLEP